MLRCFMRDTPPALHARRSSLGKMFFSAACEYRHDARNAQLCCFLYGPLQAIELEDGQQQSEGQRGFSIKLRQQLEADCLFAHGLYLGVPNSLAGHYVKTHSGPRPQDPRQVQRLVAAKCSAERIPAISDPSPPCHLLIVLCAQRQGKPFPERASARRAVV